MMLKKILLGTGGLLLLVALLVCVLAVQSILTLNAIEKEWQTTSFDKIKDLGSTQSVVILPLFEEARSRGDLEPEHGVSYLIQTDHARILFDVGMTPERLSRNMDALKVTKDDFDLVLISHIHPDHMGGTDAWWNNTIAAGNPPLDLDGNRVFVPLPVNNKELDTTVVTKPMKLANGAATTGPIAFPELFPLSLKSQRNAEQVLAIHVAGKGILLITGCGHPTIERIVSRARSIFDEPIVGVVGGLHYEGMTADQVQSHIAFVKSLNPMLVALSPHDSSTAALQEFQKAFPYVYEDLAVGRTIKFPRVGEPPLVTR